LVKNGILNFALQIFRNYVWTLEFMQMKNQLSERGLAPLKGTLERCYETHFVNSLIINSLMKFVPNG